MDWTEKEKKTSSFDTNNDRRIMIHREEGRKGKASQETTERAAAKQRVKGSSTSMDQME